MFDFDLLWLLSALLNCLTRLGLAMLAVVDMTGGLLFALGGVYIWLVFVYGCLRLRLGVWCGQFGFVWL